MKRKDERIKDNRNVENIEFGKRLYGLRTLKRLSVDRVATDAGVAPSTYREWENGRAISGQPYIKLAKAFGISLDALFGLNETQRDQILSQIEQIEISLSEIKQLV